MALWNQQTTHVEFGNFSDNPELRKELKKRRIKIAVITGVVVLVVGLSALPVYRGIREHIIAKNLEEAKAAARMENWGVARDKARSVLIARTDYDALRIWMRALGKMGEPRAYMAAAEVFMEPGATRNDKLESLQIMALQAPQAVALSAYASLPEELRDQGSFRAAIAPLLLSRGLVDAAEKGLREVMLPMDPPEVRLELLRVLCAKPLPERVAEARQIFAGLISDRADEPALAALLILGETPGGLAPGAPLPDLPAWLKNEPKATALHHLLGMHPALEGLPEAKGRLYDLAIERFLATEPGVLGTWLVRQGQAERAAEILKEPAKTRSDAFLARLNALLRLRKDEEFAELMTKAPDTADLVDLHIVQAAMAMHKNDLMMASKSWTEALNAAAFDGNRNRFIEIGQAAEMYHDEGAVMDSWVAAVCSGWGKLPLYQDLTPVFGSLATKGRSEDLLAMYRMLLRFEPYNVELRNNYLYLSLIHGLQPPETVAEAMGKLIADNPDKPEFNSALMLAYIMSGRSTEALAILPRLRESPRVAPMMIQALEGSARVLAGETEAGTALLKQVKWPAFMRQERAAFRGVLIKVEIAGLPIPEVEPTKTEADPEQVAPWRNAVKRLEAERAKDVLPPLPPIHVPANDVLPPLPANHIPGADRPLPPNGDK